MPATVQPYLLRKFKGRNGGPPENIEDTQFQELQNWFIKDEAIRRRFGTSRLSGIAYAGKLTGCAAYLPNGENYQLMVGLEDGIGWLDGNEVVSLPTTTDAIAAADDLWIMKQYKNTMYCLRADIGEIYRTDGEQVNEAGIAAPTVAAAATEGAAGALAAGDYEFVYTHYNSVSGAESDPSPSASVTIAASKKINYTAIAVSSNPQVDARKVYRSLVNQTGEWFHVFTILDNETTTYTGDNVELADMGLPAETVNGQPPLNSKTFEIHQERMWTTNGLLLYFSEIGLPESFAGTSSLNVKSDDGYLIKSIVSFGDILLVLKQSGIYYLSGSDEQSFSVRILHANHGCVAGHSAAVAEGFAFWFGGDNFYLTDGNRVNALGTTEVRDLIKDISSADYGLMQAEIYPEDGWYTCGIPENGTITKWVCYNYRTGDWHINTWGAGAGTPQWIRKVPDSNGKPVLYGVLPINEGDLFRVFDPDAADDFGTDIECTLTTKNYGFSKEDSMKFMKDIQILVSSTSVAEDLTVTLFRDDDTSSEGTSTKTTFSGKMWKRIPLANPGYPGTFLALKLDYTGDTDFSIQGLGFKIVDLGRQAPVL